MPNLGSSVGRTIISGPNLGKGTDQIGLLIAQDSFNGNAQFTISVNGVQVGGVQTATAIQADNTEELFTLNGNWAAGSTVSVDFLNDDWDGSTGNGHDRNLYVDGVTYNGTPVSNAITVTNWDGVSYYSTQATVRTDDFVGNLGVTTHLLYYDTSYVNEAVVLAELKYLGFDHVRDGGANGDPASLARFETAMAAGIKFDFATSASAGIVAAISNLETLLAEYPGSVVSTEGINEVPASFSYGGLTGEDAGNLYQQQLDAAVHTDPKLAAVSVLNYTLLPVYDQANYERYGDITSESDLANVHLYDYAGFGGLSNYISTLLPRMMTGTPNAKGFVVTETGYNTLTDSEDVSAKYLLDAVLDLKQAGARMTYLYELMDENADPGLTNSENHYGLFNSDGSPKESAVALHNLTTILADTGVDAATFTPGYLGYSLSGLPADGNSILLAKSNATFDLAVWAEPTIRGGSIAPISTVTINLRAMAALVQVFDPLLGSVPISTNANVSTLTVQVADHPLIIQIVPNTPTPSTTMSPVTEPTAIVSPDTMLPIQNIVPLIAVSVYRFFDTLNGTQFLTASAVERDDIIKTRTDLVNEGIGFKGAASITDPIAIFRMFDTTTGTHFYTASTTEEAAIAATRPDLVQEGSSFYEQASQTAGFEPVYRFFNTNNGTHFFTSNAQERENILAVRPDLSPEGIAFYTPT